MVLVHVDLWPYILGGESYESRGGELEKGRKMGQWRCRKKEAGGDGCWNPMGAENK